MKCRWLSLFLFVPMLLASAPSDLASKISSLKDAPKSQRFRLMNEIKRDMAQMNAKQRAQALQKLHATMSKKHNAPAHKEKMGARMGETRHQHQEMMRHHKVSPSSKEGQKGHQQTPKQHEASQQSKHQHDQ